MRLGDRLVERLSLGLREADLLLRGLAGARGPGESAGAPRSAAVHLAQVHHGLEGLGVAEGDVDDAVYSM